MAVCLVLMKDQGFLLTALSASVIYAVILLALFVWSSGGPRQFRAKYQYLLSR
jgi:hypothetical protein